MAFSTSTTEQCDFQWSLVFNGLAPSKTSVRPSTGRNPSTNGVFLKAASRACGVALIGLALSLSACAPYAIRDSAPARPVPADNRLPDDAVPRAEPRSRYGNGPVYEVFGKRYEVMESSRGYRAQGVASWYGNKFHGRPTASREPYDMYAMTAAHKSLPIPSYVEVRNLKNGRRVVVRVNDRGPFVDNRIIDLSYSAALKLDMVRDGTSLVEVIALDAEPAAPPTGSKAPSAASTSDERSSAADNRVYVQVGAFGSRDNALRRYRQLKDNGIRPAFVHEDGAGPATLYRVRIGPISGVAEYDRVVASLSRIGIGDSHLVSD